MTLLRDALTAYYAAERQPLVDEATRLLKGDRMTAEDVVQTTFLRLFTRLSAVHAHAHPLPLSPHLPALVHTVMLNIVRDLWRRRQYERDYEQQLGAAPSWMGQTDDVFSVCSARQMGELLEQRLARMDTSTAQVTRMNIFGGAAVGDIAKELQLNYKTAENRLQKGRRLLRQYVGRPSPAHHLHPTALQGRAVAAQKATA